jgi:hypothetical protein
MTVETYSLLKLIELLVIVTAIMISGPSTMSAYGQKTVFETPFESSTVPACSSEEVAISGVARFTFVERTDKDGNLIQRAIMEYSTVDAVGLTSGTEYKAKEVEHQIIQQDGGDNQFKTIHTSIFKGAGSEPDTYVRLHLVTIVHENGHAETLVDDLDIRCK